MHVVSQLLEKLFCQFSLVVQDDDLKWTAVSWSDYGSDCQ